MSSSESRPRPEAGSDEARTLQYQPRIPSLLILGGPIVAAAAVAGVVVLAAVTSWWLLFALFALSPVMMMVCGPVIMTAMHGPAGGGLRAAGWCLPWRRSDADRATWAR